MPWDELLKKLGYLAEPTIGEVKTQPQERFLNARPVMEQGYGEQQDLMDLMRNSNRNLAKRGSPLVINPTQEDLDNYQRAWDAAGSTGGITRAVSKYGPDVGKLVNRMAGQIESPGSSEKLIRDFEELRNFQKDAKYRPAPSELFSELEGPSQYQKIGSGMEKNVFRKAIGNPLSTRVIKIPKERIPLNNPKKEQIIFNKLNELGLDPNTRTIQTNQKSFQLQDPVKPFTKLSKEELDKIVPRDLKSANEMYNKIELENAQNEVDYFDNKINAEQLSSIFERNNQIQQALKDADPRMYQRANVEKDIIKKGLIPEDLHEENIGFDKFGKSKVLDAGMIELPNSDMNAQSEALQRLKDSYRSLPDKNKIGTREPTQDEIDEMSRELFRNTEKVNLPPFIKPPWERSSK